MMLITTAVNAIIVEQWFNGLYTATMLLTIWTISRNEESTRSNKIVWTALVLLMYMSATAHCAINWNHISSSVANNAQPGEGPSVEFALVHVARNSELLAGSFFALNIFITDCLFIWRCWMVWQRRWILVIIPICSTISGIVMAALALHKQGVLLSSGVLVNEIQTDTRDFVNFSNAFFSLSIGTSLTTTLLITLRISLVQRASRKAGLKLTSYSRVVEILVESAVMYSVTLLLFVVLESVKNEALYYPQEIHAQIAGLAPTLIILRVTAGLSRPDSHWSVRNSGNIAEMMHVSGETTSTIRFGSGVPHSEA